MDIPKKLRVARRIGAAEWHVMKDGETMSHGNVDCATFYLGSSKQPCSTDDFLRMVMTEDLRGMSMMRHDTHMMSRIEAWYAGEFEAAMKGLNDDRA